MKIIITISTLLFVICSCTYDTVEGPIFYSEPIDSGIESGADVVYWTQTSEPCDYYFK